jgi:hypothetical protein
MVIVHDNSDGRLTPNAKKHANKSGGVRNERKSQVDKSNNVSKKLFFLKFQKSKGENWVKFTKADE